MIKAGLVFVLSLLLCLSMLFFVSQFLSIILMTLGFGMILGFAFLGIGEDRAFMFFLFHILIQSGYVFLDAGTSLFVGKSALFGLVQLMNYSIAGTLFLICYTSNKDLSDLKTNKWTSFGLVVACLSLAGVPVFNLFVGEFPLYIFLFNINPLLLALALLASIMCVIAYSKPIIHSVVNESRTEASLIHKAGVCLLSSACIILGVIPWIELSIVEVLL